MITAYSELLFFCTQLQKAPRCFYALSVIRSEWNRGLRHAEERYKRVLAWIRQNIKEAL